MIFNDAGTASFPFNITNLSNSVDATNINLNQVQGGVDTFNFAGFSGGGNRGVVEISIVP